MAKIPVATPAGCTVPWIAPAAGGAEIGMTRITGFIIHLPFPVSWIEREVCVPSRGNDERAVELESGLHAARNLQGIRRSVDHDGRSGAELEPDLRVGSRGKRSLADGREDAVLQSQQIVRL